VYRACGARGEEQPDNEPSSNGAHVGAHNLAGYREPRAEDPVALARLSAPRGDVQMSRSYGAEAPGIGGQ
jgi:hypothetical protein